MDEYHYMENFGLEKDYEGGQFIGFEFFYKKRKGITVQSKDDILYGVFASGSSHPDDGDGDDDGRRKKQKCGVIINKAKYSKLVSFVSCGAVAPDKEIDNKAKEGDESDQGSAHVDLFRFGVGVGKNVGTGLGLANGKVDIEGKEREDDEAKESFLSTAFGKMIMEGAEKRRELSKLDVKKDRLSLGGSVGSFGRHTKGIGMKLLEKMGYKGGGLGKNEQGIVAPIEPSLWRKNTGIGYEDYQKCKSMPSVVNVAPPPDFNLKDKQVSVKREEKPWKKQGRARVNKNEIIIPADELLGMNEKAQGSVLVLQHVVDMRGPQARLLTNLENLNVEEKDRECDIPMPELQHNIRLIVDLAELDIQKIDRDLRMERETVVALQEHKEKLQNEAVLQKKQIDSMEEVMQVLVLIEEQHTSGRLTLESLANSFWGLQMKYRDDYKLGNLSCIACSFALPLLVGVFQGWDPLQNPTHGVDVIAMCKGLLQGDEERGIFEDASAPYSQLVAEVVFPAVRIAGINTWQARDPEPMLRFLESWEKLLPSSVLQSLLDMIVMPKLSEAVISWEPCKETIPIHLWVHPWLPLLGPKLESLYQAIRIKLVNALCYWHPSDKSAYTILLPWKTVFDAASWEQLIVRSILPKLIDVMQEFQIDPANQTLEQFHWVMTWANVVPIHHMVNLFEIHFFSKWKQVLFHWLASDPDLKEVVQWYQGWTSLFPAEFLANERVRIQFIQGLEMMDRAAEGLELVEPGMKEHISYLQALEQRKYEAQLKAAQNTSNNGRKSLKEILEVYAQHQGLHFKPKPGRFHNHHQVYSLGSVSVIVDSKHETIQAHVHGKWGMVSLDQLLQMQNVSGIRRR